MDDALHCHYHLTSCDPILAAADLFIDLINIHPFEDGNGRLCRIILSHVLIQDGRCGPFTVLNCFGVWLTDERRLALFPAGTILRDPRHLESPTRREQGLNLRGT